MPAESLEQDTGFTRSARIQQINGILLVNDGSGLYRLQPTQPEPWLRFGTESEDGRLSDAAVSSDGELVFLIRRYMVGQLFDSKPDRVELHAFDADTGEIRFEVVFSPEEREDDAPVRITQHANQTPPRITIHDFYDQMVPLEKDGQLLLVLADDTRLFGSPSFCYLRCDFRLNRFEQVELDAVAQADLRYDCTIDGYDGGRFTGSLFERELDAEFDFQQLVSARQDNVRWAASDALFGARDNGGLFGSYFPGKIYSQQSDILLYDLDRGVVPDQPARVLTPQHPQASPVYYSWVSRRDRWVVAEFDQGPSLLLQRDTAKPMAWIPALFRSSDSRGNLYRFANNDQQIVAVSFVQPTPAPQHTFFDRHEIVIFDLPDAAE